MIYNRFDLEAQKGTTFQLQLNVQDANTNPINLASYSANLTIRTDYANTLSTDILSTVTGEIQVVNAGSYMITWPAGRTANVFVDPTNGLPPKTTYVYDMNLTSNTGIVTKIMFGNFNIWGSVTP